MAEQKRTRKRCRRMIRGGTQKDLMEKWMVRGDVQRLEELLLEGRTELFRKCSTAHVQTKAFMQAAPIYVVS